MRRAGGLVLALLAACGEMPESRQPDPAGLRPGRSAAEAPAKNDAALAPTPTAPPARASAVEEKNGLYSFSYRYPAAAAAVPAVARELDGNRADLLAAVRRDAAEAKRDADRDGFPYRAYSTEAEWKVVTDTPRFLSLSQEGYEYTGGAHGMPFYGSLVWDRAAGRPLEPAAAFRSADALSAAVRRDYCQALDAERAKKRGDWKPAAVSGDPFNTCPKVSDATLLLGSSDRRSIDRLGFVIGPYTAGPYSEGAYELTLPVTPAILAIVRPEYRDAFARR